MSHPDPVFDPEDWYRKGKILCQNCGEEMTIAIAEEYGYLCTHCFEEVDPDN